MMLYIFYATSCLPPFNIAVAGERASALTDPESRNSLPVSMGFSPSAFFICAIWSCRLLIDTLWAVRALVRLCVRACRRPPGITHVRPPTPVSTVAAAVTSVIWRLRCDFSSGRRALIYVPLLSSALARFIFYFFFLPTCRSMTHVFGSVCVCVCVCVSPLRLYTYAFA